MILYHVTVDKCIRAQIVDPGSVARWIFSPEMGKYFSRFYMWEILHGTITKMNHHVNRVQDEYDNVVQRQQNSSVKMEEGKEKRGHTFANNTYCIVSKGMI